jgi:predicted acetyltransferase
VPVSIRDARSSARDRAWIEEHYPEYLEDLARLSMNTGVFAVSGEFGDRNVGLMGRWFADDSSHPLVVLKDEQPVGFALVARPPRNQREQVDYQLSEFFISLASRRRGIGRDAAQIIFRRFAGRWEISEFTYNRPAVNFWRSVVTQFTNGKFRESVAQGEVRQVFDSGAEPPAKRR